MARVFASSFAAAFTALALFGCGSGSGGSDSTGTDRVSCSKVPAAVPQPGRQHLTVPTTELPPRSVWDLRVKTNCGTFTIRVDSSISPNAAGSVISLAKSGFYDGLAIHRLAPGFVIQGGDPAADGSGGPGYRTADRPAADASYLRGTVAMAKASSESAGTAGSQFFVVTGNDAGLPPDYAVIGKVTEGMTVVDLISAQPIDASKAIGGGQEGPPKNPIVIQSIEANRIG